MELSLKQQIKVIRDMFRVNNYSCKAFDMANLNGICGLSDDEANPCIDGIKCLKDKGAIDVVQCDGKSIVQLIDYDIIVDALVVA